MLGGRHWKRELTGFHLFLLFPSRYIYIYIYIIYIYIYIYIHRSTSFAPPRKLGECYEADLQRLNSATPGSGLLQRHRLAQVTGSKQKAKSTATMNLKSLDRLPTPHQFQEDLTRLNAEAANPASPISGFAESSSGLGTGSLSVLPQPRADSADVGTPPEDPPALPGSPRRRPGPGRDGDDISEASGFLFFGVLLSSYP